MKIFGFDISRKADLTIDQIISRLEALHGTAAGVSVTPDNCEESPTVQAIVNAISMRIATLSVMVERKSRDANGEETREQLPNHPVAKLLKRPNQWQTPVEYWADAASSLVRHGRYYAIKSRGVTGPIRWLQPVSAGQIEPLMDDASLTLRFRIETGGGQREYAQSDVHYARSRSNDFFRGESPVHRARDSIALEIAAQRFGASYFGNGAMPGLIFSYMDGIKGHINAEQRNEFIGRINSMFGGGGTFKAMVLPYGMAKPEQMSIENDKAQFLETRKLQRSIIAGAFGVPPHLVGDLERSTFSNIEQQSLEFVEKVVLPYVRIFESAMERDLLTDDDRRSGVVIRFNLDSVLRADFKTRQEGLKIQREMGVISANEWREIEHYNPRAEGDVYWDQGPSGQNAKPDTTGAAHDAQLP